MIESTYQGHRVYTDSDGVTRLDVSNGPQAPQGPNSTYYKPMTYPYNHKPMQAPSPNQFGFRFRLALFPPQKPGRVSLSGNLSIKRDEVGNFIRWIQQQQPDQYGNIPLRVAMFDSVSKQGRPWLSGFAEPQDPQYQQGQAYAPAQSPGQPAPGQTPVAWQAGFGQPSQTGYAPSPQAANWQQAQPVQTTLPQQQPQEVPGSSRWTNVPSEAPTTWQAQPHADPQVPSTQAAAPAAVPPQGQATTAPPVPVPSQPPF